MKNPLKSKTIWGGLLMLGSGALHAANAGFFGPEGMLIGQAMGLVLVGWGRQTATEPLAFLPQPKDSKAEQARDDAN